MTFGLLLSFAPACDGDDGDDQAGETSGDGDTDGGDGDGDGGDGDGDGGDGDGDGGDGDGDTGELTGCAALTTEADCLAMLGCGPVRGNLLVEDGDGWCTESEEQFIGCASSAELCPMLGKTLCDGQSMWRTTGCVPDNLVPCEAPGEITGSCQNGVGKT